MAEYLDLMPVNKVAAQFVGHSPGRACPCRPVYAIDCRGTWPGQDDLRVLLHRNPGQEEDERLVRLRARKGVISQVG